MASHQYAASSALEVKTTAAERPYFWRASSPLSDRTCLVGQVYVTGHRNPDLDSIAAAIGLAELMGRLHPDDRYTPARLGDVNPQTEWALERSGAKLPEFLPHIRL